MLAINATINEATGQRIISLRGRRSKGRSALDLDEILAAFKALPEKEQKALKKEALEATKDMSFIPTAGPQMDAFFSEADLLLFGGAASGGKSALEVGLAATKHVRSLILRREATQLDGLIDFSHELLRDRGNFNSQKNIWTFDGNKQIKFGGMPREDDWRKYAGIARDLICFDEALEFSREQIFSLLGWLRTTIPGQRCRAILGSNPPRGGDGGWVFEEFGPWVDPNHDLYGTVKPGELLWAIVVSGVTEWVDGPGEYEVDGETYTAKSRTFIPSKVDDNPFIEPGYKATLQALPEPLRSQLLYGSFTAGQEDHEWQVFPSEWLQQAQARWSKNRPDHAMTAVAADVAQGGADKTQIQSRYDDWYSEFTSLDGKDTPDGPSVAAEIVKVMRDRCRVVVDAGGGYGGDTLTQLAHSDIECYGFKGQSAAGSASRDGMFKFANLRAQAIWQFREALDPAYDSAIALPPDSELYQDLCAYRYEIKGNKQDGHIVQIELKEKMKERLGRSPDKGDTTIMLHASHAGGLKRPAAAKRKLAEQQRQTQAIMRKSRSFRRVK